MIREQADRLHEFVRRSTRNGPVVPSVFMLVGVAVATWPGLGAIGAALALLGGVAALNGWVLNTIKIALIDERDYHLDRVVDRFLVVQGLAGKKFPGTDRGTTSAWKTIAMPIVHLAMESMRDRPLLRDYDLRVTLVGEQPIAREKERDWGRIAEFELVHRYKLEVGDRPSAPSWQRAIPPTLVVTDQALQRPDVRAWAATGVVDLLFPVQYRWLPRGRIPRALQHQRWLEIDGLGMKVSGVPLPFTVLPASAKLLDEVLSPLGLEADWNAVKRVTLAVGSLNGSLPSITHHIDAGSVSIESRSTYRVWIDDGLESLRWYRIPFSVPATVSAITFALSEAVFESGFRLLPASVWAPVPLVDPDARLDRREQRLSWANPPTPFLPGHGALFQWSKDPR